MSGFSNLSDDFKVITYKKRSHKKYLPKCATNFAKPAENFDKNTAARRIQEAKKEILSSDFYVSVTASLREGLIALGKPKLKEIICFGLGRFCECMIARFQLALLLCLKDLYHAKIRAYDPIFTDNEKLVLEEFDCALLHENVEGKYGVQENELTLFYLPHCPKQLSNNLLWANWGLQLNNCIIIANSFTKIIESHTKKVLSENAGYLLSISPYVLELAVINTFKYFDIFNDTAIHVFPLDKLCLISDDFWKFCVEPKYSTEDVEFITNEIQNKLQL